MHLLKVVAALAVDPTGSRVLAGSYDYNVSMYDFQGMNSQLRSFRQLQPSEGHQVRSLSWSPTGDQFIAVSGAAQAKVCRFSVILRRVGSDLSASWIRKSLLIQLSFFLLIHFLGFQILLKFWLRELF